MLRRSFFCVSCLGIPASLLAAGKKARTQTFTATAHSVEGETASGTLSRPGTAAADPKVLPLGTRIRVQGAGAYSGEYTVVDTGRAVKGREIDLYMKSNVDAKRFGRRRVRVTVLGQAERR